MDLLIGTYTDGVGGMEGRGEGIYAVSMDPETGAFSTPSLAAKCQNASALALTPDGQTLFASREFFVVDDPGVLSFSVGSPTKLSKLSQLSLNGELPCQLSFDPTHSRLASAQYWTGDLAVIDVMNGALQPSPVYFNREGTGPNPDRQEGPHAHCTAFSDDGAVVHVVDLGTDAVISHKLDAQKNPVEVRSVKFTPGAGPRHMVINNDATQAFVVCELDESLVALNRKGIGWEIASVQPGFVDVPKGEDGSAAAIRLSRDQRHIYISGRRNSNIACFAVGDGVSAVAEIETGGKTPRDFIVSSDGNWVIAANQDTDNIVSFRRDHETGKLTATGNSCTIGTPVSLVELT